MNRSDGWPFAQSKHKGPFTLRQQKCALHNIFFQTNFICTYCTKLSWNKVCTVPTIQFVMVLLMTLYGPEANVLHWRKYLRHCWDFWRPPEWFGTHIVNQRPGNCAPLAPLVTSLDQTNVKNYTHRSKIHIDAAQSTMNRNSNAQASKRVWREFEQYQSEIAHGLQSSIVQLAKSAQRTTQNLCSLNISNELDRNNAWCLCKLISLMSER